MALQEQTIPIILGQGIDTKTASPEVVAGKLLNLSNGIFQTGKQISKRNGYAALSQTIQGGGTISSGVNLAQYNQELIELDGNNLYSYVSGTSSFANKGSLITTSISTTQIVRNNFQQGQSDSAINGSYRAFAWNDSSNGGSIRYSVVDTSTGQTLVNNALLTSNASSVKVLSIGTSFVFFYYDTSTFASLYCKVVSTSTPSTLGTQTTVASDLNTTNHIFDAEVIGAKIVIVYGATTSRIAMYSMSSSLIFSGQYIAATGQTPSQGLTAFADASGNAWVGWGDGTNVKALIANSTLTANVLNTTTIDTQSAVRHITGAVTSTTGTFYYETGPTVSGYFASYQNLISQVTLTSGGSVGTPSVFNRGLGLASKVFVFGGVYYVVTTFPTVLQATYFVMNLTAHVVVGKISQGDGGFQLSDNILAEVNLVSSGVFEFTTQIKDQIVAFQQASSGRAASNNLYTQTGIQSVTLTFQPVARPKLVMGNNLHIAGGILQMYDGGSVVEHGFNIYPEGLGFTQTLTGGGVGIGASTDAQNQVQYQALYEWSDDQGQLHKSAVGPPLTVPLPVISALSFTGNVSLNSTAVSGVSSIAGLVVGQIVSNTNFPALTYITALVSSSSITLSAPATATASSSAFTTKDIGTITAIVPTLRVSSKTNVSIVLYRTQNNGSIFYRVTSPTTLIYNDPTTDNISIVDSLPDSQIVGNEQLYTTGGEVENIAAPAFNAVCSYKNRFVGIPSENAFTFQYSKQTIPGTPVEFSDEFIQNVDPTGGPIIVPVQMDDKLILFKTNYIFLEAGDGPTPAGTSNDFIEPQIISTDTGCNNPASVVLMPGGIMYQSPKGFYLLDRSLNNSYIGADVEAFNSFTVTSALLMATVNQVRYTLNNGTALVYDYYYSQWSTFTNHNAVDAILYKNNFNFVTSAGLVLQETPGVYTDNGAFIQLSFTTGWLQLSVIQNYQRVWRMNILGAYKSPHTLQINVATDYASSFFQNVSIPVLSAPSVPYQFRIDMEVQKCQTIQIQIQDTQSTPFGEGFNLTALSFDAGLKKGMDKLPAAQTFG